MSDRGCAVPDCEAPYSCSGYCAVHAARVRRNGHTELLGRPRKPLAERLWPRVDRSGGPDACWPWTGPLSKEGYGTIRPGGYAKMVGAHRAAWLLVNPQAPEPEVLDHMCHDPRQCRGGPNCPHRRCCNPAHLEPSTVSENMSAARQRVPSQRTRCKRGHEYTEANTYRWVDPNGYVTRHCRQCRSDRRRAVA